MATEQFEYKRVRYADRVLSQTLGGEAVVLELKSEQYFGLDATGTRIWQLIGELGDVRQIYEAMIAEYDADPAVLARDLRLLLDRLIAAGLIRADA